MAPGTFPRILLIFFKCLSFWLYWCFVEWKYFTRKHPKHTIWVIVMPIDRSETFVQWTLLWRYCVRVFAHGGSWEFQLKQQLRLRWIHCLKCLKNEYIFTWEKGRDLTQSYEKSPYTHRKIKKPTWRQHNDATKNFDYTTIVDRLRTDSWSNNIHPCGMVNRVTGTHTFPLTAKPCNQKDKHGSYACCQVHVPTSRWKYFAK